MTLTPTTALGGTAARTDTIGAFTVTEVPDLALASLAARKDAQAPLNAAMAPLLGAELPDIGQSAGDGLVSAFWMGPGQWMLCAPYTSHALLAAELAAAAGPHGAVTEQNDGWVTFDIEATAGGATALFERLCVLNTAEMEAGAVARTAIHHLGCFVQCLKTGQKFRVLGARSSAASLHHALTTAARSLS